jgi:hypothetical protein
LEEGVTEKVVLVLDALGVEDICTQYWKFREET